MSESSIKIQDMLNGIVEALSGFPDFKNIQNTDELSESIPETPIVQVYFEGKEFVSSSVDKLSFNSINPIRKSVYTFHIDVYSAQRASISRDMERVIRHIDAIDEILGKQNKSPFFGVNGVKAFSYRVERVFFEYASSKYVGSRFVLLLTVI